MELSDKYKKIWAEIVAKAWTDEKFKKRLFAHPEEVFKEYGLPVDPSVHYKLMEETPGTKREIILTFPKKPEGEMSEEELRKMSGAGPTSCMCQCVCLSGSC